jgi:hypothetical protein
MNRSLSVIDQKHTILPNTDIILAPAYQSKQRKIA